MAVYKDKKLIFLKSHYYSRINNLNNYILKQKYIHKYDRREKVLKANIILGLNIKWKNYKDNCRWWRNGMKKYIILNQVWSKSFLY